MLSMSAFSLGRLWGAKREKQLPKNIEAEGNEEDATDQEDSVSCMSEPTGEGAAVSDAGRDVEVEDATDESVIAAINPEPTHKRKRSDDFVGFSARCDDDAAWPVLKAQLDQSPFVDRITTDELIEQMVLKRKPCARAPQPFQRIIRARYYKRPAADRPKAGAFFFLTEQDAAFAELKKEAEGVTNGAIRFATEIDGPLPPKTSGRKGRRLRRKPWSVKKPKLPGTIARARTVTTAPQQLPPCYSIEQLDLGVPLPPDAYFMYAAPTPAVSCPPPPPPSFAPSKTELRLPQYNVAKPGAQRWSSAVSGPGILRGRTSSGSSRRGTPVDQVCFDSVMPTQEQRVWRESVCVV